MTERKKVTLLKLFKKMGNNARVVIKNQYNINAMVNIYRDVIKKTVKIQTIERLNQ